jgi:hypothetical protein
LGGKPEDQYFFAMFNLPIGLIGVAHTQTAAERIGQWQTQCAAKSCT